MAIFELNCCFRIGIIRENKHRRTTAFAMKQTNARITELRARLTAMERERADVVAEINTLQSMRSEETEPIKVVPSGHAGDPTDRNSPIEKKLALFRRLFRGRSDVYPIRWENRTTERSGYAPACANEWRRGICEKPRVKCSACPNQAFLPVDDVAIERHLRGTDPNGAPFVMGVYPMLADNACSFLAADFDEGDWRRDAFAFRDACERHGIPVAIERSRSGNGAHAWIFFDEPISAAWARRLGAFLITDAMERVPDIGFGSYDRFFPSQDIMPAGGFGNLIALPLQGLARSSGNSEFIDDSCSPYPDQWAFLSAIAAMPRAKVEHLVEEASASGKILGVRIPLADEDEEPWLAPPSRRQAPPAIREPLPGAITVVQADQIYLPRHALPPSLIARLIRLAAFQNPEFYAAQAMRRSTHDKPRIISCAELTSHHVALPRGCFDAVLDLLASFGITVTIEDCRFSGAAIPFAFTGELRSDQGTAIAALLPHDTGVLAATTAFGKTILAIRMMAERGRNTLVLVHRRQLMDQWIERLTAFSNMPRDAIGMIGGGRRKPKGQVDVALIQSLVRKLEVDDIVGNYGHLVVDECHHLSAVSFELVARRSKARYVLGLSATVTRKDGHHPIIVMQCGPVRHRVDARSEAAKRPFDHVVRIRDTGFQLQTALDTSVPSIQEVFKEMIADEARNDLIFDDVLTALEAGRSPVVITERTAHLEIIAKRLERFAKHVVVLRGGQSEKQRRDIAARLAAIPQAEERVIVATGRYLGEGFDDSRLDTLFLTMPIAWKGTLAQYAGRLHRLNDVKREVIIYDYADMRVPVLARMAAKRRVGYQAIGYKVLGTRDLFSDRAVTPNEPT
ncbi:superfamily II DNA or RNA helicase [Bradyrhizobium sp. S3.2.6]|uniref:TOTE conflict system archaeo-eukaryotic primase domain-containing protein n=1 Tax=Bradyrhizobium sp. S3.2.6 TaxID=3156428 RepID=UPI0033907EE2